VEALLRAGADKEAKRKGGYTPLLEASGSGHLAVVEALLRAGANLEAEDKNGLTPLAVASAAGYIWRLWRPCCELARTRRRRTRKGTPH
jgi:ankyrin repeat protein